MTAMTPDEACQQECPLIRYCENPSQVMQDNTPALYAHAICRGPDCKIGWRWEKKRRPKIMVTLPGKPEEEWAWDPRGDERFPGAEVRLEDRERLGYCGAFGKPGDE